VVTCVKILLFKCWDYDNSEIQPIKLNIVMNLSKAVWTSDQKHWIKVFYLFL